MKNPKGSVDTTPRTGPDERPADVVVEASQRYDEPIVLNVNSGKGGVGKTALAHVAVHTALALGKKPVIFDFDAANPDLWAAWTEIDASDRFALDRESFEGWNSVLKMIEALDASYVIVIDLPANSGIVAEKYLSPMMEVGGYHATLWALDPGRKPMDALLRHCSGPTMEPVVVAKSVFKTENGDEDFGVWKKFGAGVDLRGGFVFDVPNLESAVRLAMVEGGEDVMTVADLGSDRGAWSIDRILKDDKNRLRGIRARDWLKKMRPQIERAMIAARRVAS